MQRIMIIGSPGSGKSTLARTLGDQLGLPVYHMDREVHWLPDWQERTPDEKLRIAREIVARDDWVFEGGHSTSYPDRLARADLLIWLDLPTGLRLMRVIRRSFRDRGRTRLDMQDNCPERIDMLPEFIRFILRTGRSSQRKQAAIYEAATCPKHHLRNQAAVDKFVSSIKVEK